MTAKRLFDIGFIFLLSPLVLLLLTVISGLVAYNFGRPVLFRQKRPGLKGEPFSIVKFRTMNNERDETGNLLPDELRLTRFGRFLRSTSLDELPEIWNVLRGEMSLVGPRPLLMEYLDRYSEDQAKRHDVLPGITGLAQVKGRNALCWEEKFAYDIEYVDNHNLWVDMKILAMTGLSIFRREGISAEGYATMPFFMGTEEPFAGSETRDKETNYTKS